MIVRPDNSLIIGSQHYYKHDCISWASLDCRPDYIRMDWKKLYKEGYRCKKVKVTYELVEGKK